MNDDSGSNAETREDWEGPMFEGFVRFRHLVSAGLTRYGEAVTEACPPPVGGRVLDLGCGFGESTRRLAALVGPGGEALGVDISEAFVELARGEATDAGVENCEFRRLDVQTADLGGGFDYAFSQMGLMFFADPTAAFRNVGAALEPGAALCAAVWRRPEDNPWARRGGEVVAAHLGPPEDDAVEGPGPFSMADADALTDLLAEAGFGEVSLSRRDLPMPIGTDLDEAVVFATSFGVGGRLLRAAGERGDSMRPAIEAEMRSALAEFDGPDGVSAPGSAWIVVARAV